MRISEENTVFSNFGLPTMSLTKRMLRCAESITIAGENVFVWPNK